EARRGLSPGETAVNVRSQHALDARKSSSRRSSARRGTFLTMAYIISVNARSSPTPAAVHGAGLRARVQVRDDPGTELPVAHEGDLVVATRCRRRSAPRDGRLRQPALALAPHGRQRFFAYTWSVPRLRAVRTDALAAVMLEAASSSRSGAHDPRSIRSLRRRIGLFSPSRACRPTKGPSTLVTLAACSAPTHHRRLPRAPCAAHFLARAAGFAVTATMIYASSSFTLRDGLPGHPARDSSFEYFRKVVDFHTIKTTAGRIGFSGFGRTDVWLAVITLLYVDVLDTTGAMYSMAEYAGFADGGGGFEGEYRAFIVDAGSTIVGAALGTRRAGGRGSRRSRVPPWAVGPSLVLMAKEIEWGDAKEGVPAFLTMLLMPLTFSIANGIIAGAAAYVLLHLWDYAVGLWRLMEEAHNQVSAAAADVPAAPV
ncbi:Adenine/guanine permease AZG2, partial [Ananas comosus]